MREQLIEHNKSEEYIENVISRLEQWDDIDEITLNEDADDHLRIFDAFGYADGICFAKENHIQQTMQFTDMMADNYARCMNYGYIAPVEDLALYQTIIDFNRKCAETIPITDAQIRLTEELKKEIEIDNNIFGS